MNNPPRYESRIFGGVMLDEVNEAVRPIAEELIESYTGEISPADLRSLEEGSYVGVDEDEFTLVTRLLNPKNRTDTSYGLGVICAKDYDSTARPHLETVMGWSLGQHGEKFRALRPLGLVLYQSAIQTAITTINPDVKSLSSWEPRLMADNGNLLPQRDINYLI